ncbi:MAG: hypothetical protein EOM11_09965 [Erysipelotrichia bacterium]|nr:hypothetical protein [Erysipelotrichia bacterium]
MTNYENEIMNLLIGDTPKQKYEYLLKVLRPDINDKTKRTELKDMYQDNYFNVIKAGDEMIIVTV